MTLDMSHKFISTVPYNLNQLILIDITGKTPEKMDAI